MRLSAGESLPGRRGATPLCRPTGVRPFFDSYPALSHPSEPRAGSLGAPVTRWANPPVALNGLVVTVPNIGCR